MLGRIHTIPLPIGFLGNKVEVIPVPPTLTGAKSGGLKKNGGSVALAILSAFPLFPDPELRPFQGAHPGGRRHDEGYKYQDRYRHQ